MAEPSGICPFCNAVLGRLAIESLDGTIYPDEPDWRLLAFQCPDCRSVLSVQVDPVALKNEIVRELKHR